jgi:hypothetical protein
MEKMGMKIMRQSIRTMATTDMFTDWSAKTSTNNGRVKGTSGDVMATITRTNVLFASKTDEMKGAVTPVAILVSKSEATAYLG